MQLTTILTWSPMQLLSGKWINNYRESITPVLKQNLEGRSDIELGVIRIQMVTDDGDGQRSLMKFPKGIH